MTAVGLITEYNPFHNGHQHHLRESRRVAGAEVAVAVMSGHFLQRGMPALLDKWVRTEMALAGGVDLVLELPVVWACNSAPHFAAGAMALLAGCGGIDSCCFGSERGELPPLQACADLLDRTAAAIAHETGARLRTGISYPIARAAALQSYPGLSDLLATPNNILGISYLQALVAQKSSIRPLTIPRIGAGYHDSLPQGEIASASGLRRLYAQGEELAPFMPLPAHQLLESARQCGNILHAGALFPLLLARLSDDPASLNGLYQVEDGIGERLCHSARQSHSLAELIDAAKVRHLTVSRIQRILAYIFLNLRAEVVEEQLTSGPPYLRLLGATASGERFLAATRKERTLPLLGNFSRAGAELKRFYGVGCPAWKRATTLLSLETKATRLYTLLLTAWSGADRNRDYYEIVRRWGRD